MGMGSISAIFAPTFLPNRLTRISSNTIRPLRSSLVTTPTRNPIRSPSRIFAEGNGCGDGGRRSAALNIRWRDLLDPDPKNIVAVELAGLLTWARVNVLWQVFFVSFAILLAAIKYSFIAALLLFILITLL